MVFSGRTEFVMTDGGSNMGDIMAGLVKQICGRVKVQVLFITKHCVERL